MDARLFELIKAYLSSGSDSINSLDFYRRLKAIVDIYNQDGKPDTLERRSIFPVNKNL